MNKVTRFLKRQEERELAWEREQRGWSKLDQEIIMDKLGPRLYKNLRFINGDAPLICVVWAVLHWLVTIGGTLVAGYVVSFSSLELTRSMGHLMGAYTVTYSLMIIVAWATDSIGILDAFINPVAPAISGLLAWAIVGDVRLMGFAVGNYIMQMLIETLAWFAAEQLAKARKALARRRAVAGA